jgi:glycosyltransferase involved in cell wall biosynthesis
VTSLAVDPATPAKKGRVPLSVVIIAENEEEWIRECIESVFAACRGVSAYEVILVDSASTDRTVERAAEYPITILRIPEEHAISCGAGRYVGDRVASGEYVCHVDGDMTLTETWLPRAMEYLYDHADAAAVEGCLDSSTQTDVREVNKVGGVMLYDAHALAEVGGFDPYLLGYEDVDVGFQLKTAGYRLVRLPEVSAEHHDEGGAIAEPLRRWRQGYAVAPGQAIRKRARSPRVLRLLIGRQRYSLGLLAWLVAGVAAAASRRRRRGWLLLSVAAFAAVAARLGVPDAVGFVAAKAIGIVGLAVGLGRPTRRPESFPVSTVEVVAPGETFHGESSS